MPVFCTDDVLRQTNFFTQNLLALLDAHAPLRTFKVRNPNPPPLSDNTKQLLVVRRAARARGDNAVYRDINRRANAAILRDTRESIARRIAEAGQGSMYRCIQSVIGSGRGSSKVPNIDPDTLNVYFSEIGVRTAAAVNASRLTGSAPILDMPVRLPRVVADGFCVQPIAIDELYTIVHSANASKACDCDGVSMSFFKQCFESVSHVLLCIINTSLVTGIVPKPWKLSVIQPIYKAAGALTDPSSFRPISLVPCIAKIIERIVHGQLYSYFTSRHLFSECQHGFRLNHSTETALSITRVPTPAEKLLKFCISMSTLV